MNATQWMNRVIKPAVFVLCLLPLAWLGWDAYMHQLGANPVEKMSHRTGEWAFKLLLITLTVTPLRKLTGWNSVIRLRRMRVADPTCGDIHQYDDAPPRHALGQAASTGLRRGDARGSALPVAREGRRARARYLRPDRRRSAGLAGMVAPPRRRHTSPRGWHGPS